VKHEWFILAEAKKHPLRQAMKQPTGNDGFLASLLGRSNGKYSNTKHIFSEGNRHDCGVRKKWLKENYMLVHCIELH